jgi:succinoglycan biosynthesis transport protein ExoP
LDVRKESIPVDVEQSKVDPGRWLGVLRRRAAWIVLCVVLVAGVAYGLSKRQTKKYTATAALVFNNNQLGQQVAGLQALNSSGNPQNQQATDLKLVQLGDMGEKTAIVLAHAKGATPLARALTGEKVEADVSASVQGESNVINVSATSTSPVLAAAIANKYTAEFVYEQQNSNHAYYIAALKLVDKQLSALSSKQRLSTAGVALQDRAQSLGVLAELHNGSVEVAKAAKVPTSPSSPTTSKNTALGAVLGLLLGLGIAFLLERVDRRIREPKDLEAIYDLPLLGVVPESKALSRSARRGGDAPAVLPPGEAESFQLIRAHLRYFNVDRQVHTLLVASAAPGDGKTTIARHLAAAAARVGSRVLLLEADLRRPTLAQRLDVRSGPGLADVLIGAVLLNDAIQTVDLEAPSDTSAGGRAFDVLVAGAALPPNPGELIESRAMETVLERAKSTYDLVVVDTPPLTAVSDAFPLLGKVDGVVIVGRVGRNRRDVAERLHETLAGAGAPLLGVIANGLTARRGDYGGYGYTYDYTSKRPPAPKDEAAAAPAPDATAPAGANAAATPIATPTPAAATRGSPNGGQATGGRSPVPPVRTGQS